MAASICANRAAVRLLHYGKSTRSIQALVSKTRNFSGPEDRDPSLAILLEDQAKPVAWPDETMGPLNVPDFRFALPGNVGVSKREDNTANEQKKTEGQVETDILPHGSPERHLTVISQLIAESDYLDPEFRPDTKIADCFWKKYFESAKVELAIQDCPQIVYKDFAALFPGMPSTIKLTIITVTQRTENDMSGWSSTVDAEREKLLENFITTAMEICHLLKSHSFWCDFIDPSSGQPYFGAYSNTTLYETDERYRHLGFQIEDLGCCKVIYHKIWGSKVFVGSLFTVAPKEHKVMKDLLKVLD